jgi:hypothetical protein
MKYYTLFILFLFPFTFYSNGQVNLVLNPSFEVIDTCPIVYSQIMLAVGWDTLRNGGGITPDLFNACDTFPGPEFGVPVNMGQHGFQYAKSGNGYGGLVALYASPQIREYIQGTLISTLHDGKNYCVKAYINLANFSRFSCNSFGIYLDDGQISANSDIGELPNVNPQIIYAGLQLDDTISWVKIEGSFISSGTEEYITIGNFLPDSLSNPVYFNPAGNMTGSYYYLDDVSVIESDLPAYAGNDTVIHPGDSVFIGRQPEIGLNEDCIWFVDGTAIDTIAGMWVTPDSSTTYIIEQTICSNVSYDTVTVIVDTATGIHENNEIYLIKIFPNPAQNTLNIECNNEISQIFISDILGNVKIKQQCNTHSAIIDISDIYKGLYFLKVVSEKGIVVKKIIKE